MTQPTEKSPPSVDFHGVHHVGLLCKDLNASLAFYRDMLGLKVNTHRPDALPIRGAWLWVGPEMIHLLELSNQDQKENGQDRGVFDRHVALGIDNMDPVIEKLQSAGIAYDRGVIGRRAIFFRDPGYGPHVVCRERCVDMNCLEVFEVNDWH